MLKKLKGLFIEEDNDKIGEKSNPSDTSKDKIEKTEIKLDDENPVPLVESNSTKPDDKFVDILLKAVEKNNMEGFDYLEYKSSLQSLVTMDMDEETKYQSAMAMAKTMGATPEKLISSAKHYVSILKKEDEKFKKALVNQRSKQVTSKENEILSLKKDIEEKQRQIEKLEAGILNSQKKLEDLKGGINKAAARVQQTSDSFNLAYEVVTRQILNDIKNIEKHIK